jgi:predicted Zn-dependent peptidase
MSNILATRLRYEWLLNLTSQGKMEEAHEALETLSDEDKKEVHKLTIQEELAAVKREKERQELTEDEIRLVQEALSNASVDTLRFLAAITYDYMRVYLKFRPKDFSKLIKIAEKEASKAKPK